MNMMFRENCLDHLVGIENQDLPAPHREIMQYLTTQGYVASYEEEGELVYELTEAGYNFLRYHRPQR